MYGIDDGFYEFRLIDSKKQIKTSFDFIIRFDNELESNRKIKLKLKENLIFDISYLNTKALAGLNPKSNINTVRNFGDTLLEFINNYEQIVNCCKNFSKDIKHSFYSKSKDLKETRFKELNGIRASRILYTNFCRELDKIKNIDICRYLIKNDIFTFYNNFISKTKNDYYEFIHGLNSMKYQLEKCTDVKSNTYDDLTFYSELLKSFLNKAEGIKYYQEAWINFITNYIKDLKKIYMICIKSFYNNTINDFHRQTNKFIGNKLELPIVKINIDTDNSKKILEYKYTTNSFKDLANATLYHMILNNNVITKCNYCNTYFIPRTRNDEIYCHKFIKMSTFGDPLYCNDIAKSKKYENQIYNVYKLYKALLDRLTIRIKKNDDNVTDYKEKLNYLQENYKKITLKYQKLVDNISKEEVNYETTKNTIYKEKREELRHFLVKFDKEFQKLYPIHRGRKYDTQKYWTENKTK